MIQAEAKATLDALESSAGTTTGLLKHNTANYWIDKAKKQPRPRYLFDEFWIEGEICILYADTNVGKSILAVQIGDSISKGMATDGFRMTAEKQKILYFDFELSEKQFEERYSVDFQEHYQFDDNFIRVEIDPDARIPDNQTFEDFLADSIEKLISDSGIKILIIDNLTYLRNETEKAASAAPLMQHLNNLKKRYGLSLLILAHTPKRDPTRPITRNDAQGSSRLMQFTDAAFAIGQSQKDKNLRYLKQVKIRIARLAYDGENVAICQINKPSNFVRFELLAFEREKDHLKEITDQDREQRIADALTLKKQGLSNCQIASQLGVTEGSVRKWLKKHSN
ncbi:LuxR family transcriptional regulator [Emticicia agri]|uniref:LuxR family transcriptional regulator n=2 Tax=Emticicia agri TaxID=2492393 RepID=A0A4Q5M2C9_9BACT|nr:LuxR family transcriptional regulator [Emticicia agri]